MSNVYYLTNVPCDGKLNVGDDAYFHWDGKDELVLSVKGCYGTSILHFTPGNAFRAKEYGGVVKLSRLEVPHTLPGVVLWACHAEKNARVKTAEIFRRKLEQFKSTHRILEPESGFSPVWKTHHRIGIKKCTGPFLFITSEEKLQIARYAKHKGTMWATVAAYCDPNITRDEAKELIRKYGIIEAPRWYIRNAIHEADGCNMKEKERNDTGGGINNRLVGQEKDV